VIINLSILQQNAAKKFK